MFGRKEKKTTIKTLPRRHRAMKTIIIGRDKSCNYLIYDPKNRVSRKHLEVISKAGKIFIKDIGSTNGTYVNGEKLPVNKEKEVFYSDKITLSSDYILELHRIIPKDEDNTLFLDRGINTKPSVQVENNKTVYRSQDKVIEFDRDKTTIGEILEVENIPFKTIGRNKDCDFSINDGNISREHCRIRLINPLLIEIEDLGSTNGTFADDEKLIKEKKYQFDTAVNLRLGSGYLLDIKKIFPEINIIKKSTPAEYSSPPPGSLITPQEEKQFRELEDLWNEYTLRQNQANNVALGMGIGGALVGAVLGAVTGGIGGVLLSGGGGVLGKYLGQQKSSKIRQDLNYETAFLETYCCPRCKESFQKKPWITIRDCFKCKLKFR